MCGDILDYYGVFKNCLNFLCVPLSIVTHRRAAIYLCSPGWRLPGRLHCSPTDEMKGVLWEKPVYFQVVWVKVTIPSSSSSLWETTLYLMVLVGSSLRRILLHSAPKRGPNVGYLGITSSLSPRLVWGWVLSQTEVQKDLCPYISLARHMLVTHGNVEISESSLYIERVYLQLRNEVSTWREVGISRKNKKKIEHGLRRLIQIFRLASQILSWLICLPS